MRGGLDEDGLSATSPIPAFPRERGKELARDAFDFWFNQSNNTSLLTEALSRALLTNCSI
jgi:hypothetical protein